MTTYPDIFETGPETTPGPRVRAEVYIEPETKIEMFAFGSGAGVRIGEFYDSNTYIGLGHDAKSRRDACTRLISVLAACLAFEEEPPAPDVDMETRDALIVGEFR